MTRRNGTDKTRRPFPSKWWEERDIMCFLEFLFSLAKANFASASHSMKWKDVMVLYLGIYVCIYEEIIRCRELESEWGRYMKVCIYKPEGRWAARGEQSQSPSPPFHTLDSCQDFIFGTKLAKNNVFSSSASLTVCFFPSFSSSLLAPFYVRMW